MNFHQLLRDCGLFDLVSYTDEDRARGRMHQSRIAREELERSSSNLDAYLAGLDSLACASCLYRRCRRRR